MTLAGGTAMRGLRRAQTTGYYIAFVALGMVGASLGPTLPGLASQTQSQLAQVSYLFTARAFGYLLGSFAGGRLYDRFRGHRVMATVLAVVALMLALVPAVPLLPLLIAVLFIIGLSEGALDVGGNTLLVWVQGARVGPFMNGLHFFWGVGAFLSPIIVAWAIARTGGIAWAYRGLALLMLPALVWLLRIASPPHPAHVRAATQPATASGRLAAPASLIITIMAFLFLYVGAEVSFGGWIFTFAVSEGLVTATAAALLTATFWGALTIGRLLTIPLTARLRPAALLAACLAGCVATCGVLIVWAGTAPVVWGAAVLMGLCMAPIFPVTITLAGTLMPISGRVTAWFFVGASAGGMVVPWVIGQLFEPVGAGITMIVILLDLLLACAVLVGLMLEARQRRRWLTAVQ
jgi:FHS family Na+ dependent glucose MFS transporter 1